MKINELYENWREYKVIVNYVENGERVQEEIHLGRHFAECFWTDDEKALIFYSYSGKSSVSVLKCVDEGHCYICYKKDPKGEEDEGLKDSWIKIGWLAKKLPK